ncbi:thermonuclease family protein [Aeromonas taiwanensis]
MPITTVLFCLVVGVTDGDTIKAVCEGKQVKIRLADIDAPEKSQPWGQRSKQALSELCFQKRAEIRPSTTDRYGRTVARVICEGTDANLAQVRSGMAWAYTKYLKDPAVAAEQTQAREARYGLWTDAEPVPPWEWRHAAKQAHAK